VSYQPHEISLRITESGNYSWFDHPSSTLHSFTVRYILNLLSTHPINRPLSIQAIMAFGLKSKPSPSTLQLCPLHLSFVFRSAPMGGRVQISLALYTVEVTHPNTFSIYLPPSDSVTPKLKVPPDHQCPYLIPELTQQPSSS
jgi:hypothetical protein